MDSEGQDRQIAIDFWRKRASELETRIKEERLRVRTRGREAQENLTALIVERQMCLLLIKTAQGVGTMMRDNYKHHILIAKADKLRDQPIWHARVFMERQITGGWEEVPILPGLEGQQFTSEQDALPAALAPGRWYVDGIPQSRQ